MLPVSLMLGLGPHENRGDVILVSFSVRAWKPNFQAPKHMNTERFEILIWNCLDLERLEPKHSYAIVLTIQKPNQYIWFKMLAMTIQNPSIYPSKIEHHWTSKRIQPFKIWMR